MSEHYQTALLPLHKSTSRGAAEGLFHIKHSPPPYQQPEFLLYFTTYTKEKGSLPYFSFLIGAPLLSTNDKLSPWVIAVGLE